MAIKDIESSLQPIVGLDATFVGNTTELGVAFDMQNYEIGILFTLDVFDFTDGTYELQLFEADNSSMTGATQVIAPNILPTDLGANSISQNMLVTAGQILEKIGAYGTKRYVQPRVTSTGVTIGAQVRVVCIRQGEIDPVKFSAP